MNNIIKKFTSLVVICAFSVSVMLPSNACAQTAFDLPEVGQMISLTPSYDPATMKGLRLFPENPLRFDFIIDKGDSEFSEEGFKAESTKLIKYFLTSLTIPENDLWVNLSPYEQDRIVPNEFGITEMGRDLLAEDYLLKQITSSLMYPENELGKEFWDKVYDKALKEFGTTEIPLDTFNKVWIVPEKAVVYAKGDTAFVVESKLKVMLEEDYVALNRGKEVKEVGEVEKERIDTSNTSNIKFTQGTSITSTIASNIIREIIIPALEKEVNEGKNFANLRQIYNSLILATWYKMNLKNSLLSKVFVDKNKIAGGEVTDKQIKEKIYEQYIESFKKGVYDYVKEDFDPMTQQIIPRKYFSGGIQLAKDTAMVIEQTNKMPNDFAMKKQNEKMVWVKSSQEILQKGDAAMTIDSKEINDQLTYNQKKIVDNFFEKIRIAKGRQKRELILPNGKKIGSSELEKILKNSLIDSIKEIYIEREFIVTDQLIDSFRNESIFQVRGSVFYLQEGGDVPWEIVNDLDIFLYLPKDLFRFIDLHGIQAELRKKFNEKALWYLNFNKSNKKVMLDFFPKDRLFSEKYAQISKPYRKDMWYVASEDVINSIEQEIEFNDRDYLKYLLSEYHELVQNVRNMTQMLFPKQGKILNRLIELAVLRGDSDREKELLKLRLEIYHNQKQKLSKEELVKLVDEADPGFFNLGFNDEKLFKAYLYRQENDQNMTSIDISGLDKKALRRFEFWNAKRKKDLDELFPDIENSSENNFKNKILGIVRELVRNSFDAVVIRAMQEDDGYVPFINLDIKALESGFLQIVLEDNGSGMGYKVFEGFMDRMDVGTKGSPELEALKEVIPFHGKNGLGAFLSKKELDEKGNWYSIQINTNDGGKKSYSKYYEEGKRLGISEIDKEGQGTKIIIKIQLKDYLKSFSVGTEYKGLWELYDGREKSKPGFNIMAKESELYFDLLEKFKNAEQYGYKKNFMSDLDFDVVDHFIKVIVPMGYSYKDLPPTFLIDEKGLSREIKEDSRKIIKELNDIFQAKKDKAMAAPGGIDLNPAKIDLQTKGEGIDFEFKYTDEEFENLDFQGLSPVIFEIVPVTNLPLLLGINAPQSNNSA